MKGQRMPMPKKIAAYRKEGWKEIPVQKQGYPVQRGFLASPAGGIVCVARYRFEWSWFTTRPERKRMTFSFVLMRPFRRDRLSSGIMIAGASKKVSWRPNNLWDLSPRMGLVQ